jgi:hypothetical protein
MMLRHLSPICALVVLVACSGGGSSPTAPPVARAAVTVTVSPVAVSRTATGYEYDFTVTARETGGVAATLTALNVSLFSASSSRGTATITNAFSVTALTASGSQTSRAITVSETSSDPLAAVRLQAAITFTDSTGSQTSSADATLAAVPTSFTLSGTVSMAAPSSTTRLNGARVEVVDGAYAGKSAITDGSGNFSIPGLVGGMTVRATLAGYAEQSLSATMTQDRTLSFGLRPDARTIDETYTGEISGGTPTSCSDGIFTKPCVTITIAIHNSGNLAAELDWAGSGDLDLTLWRGTTLIAESRKASGRENISSFLSGGSSYQLKITYYSGAVIAPYTLRVTRMN